MQKYINNTHFCMAMGIFTFHKQIGLDGYHFIFS